MASLNKKFYFSSTSDFFDLVFTPNDSDSVPKIINAHDLNFDFELVKTKNWDLPFKLSAKNFSSPSGPIVQYGELMARGIWSNDSTDCEIMAILSNQEACGKIINIVDLSMDLQDPSGTIKFNGNGYCVAPKSGCPQRIDARIMSKSTANIFSQIMRSGFLNPLIGGILIGSLLGSPVIENPNYDHSVDLKMRGSLVLMNGKPLI